MRLAISYEKLSRIARFSLALIAFAWPVVAVAQSTPPLVYVVTSQQFGTLELATGLFHPIGSGTFPNALANLVWKNGSLLSLDTASGDLVEINPATGDIKHIGPTGMGVCGAGSCAFALGEARGTLYSTDLSNNIYSVNPYTGAATLLRATGIPADPHTPLTFTCDGGTFCLCDEGLYNMGGKLYATFDSFAIDPTRTLPNRPYEYVPPGLYQIDPSTGAATFVAPTDWQLTALLDVDGKFYAFRGVIDGFNFDFGFPVAHTELVTLDLKTGQTNKLIDIDPSIGPIFGAAPVRNPH